MYSVVVEGGEWKMCGFANGPLVSQPEATVTETVEVQSSKQTPTAVEDPAPTGSPTADVRPLPESWSSWPVLPVMSDRAREIYETGIEMGNDPNAFSIIGDCQSEPSVFMGIYATDRYFLGEGFDYLQETIDQFAGSLDRDHITVKKGLSCCLSFF